MCTNLENTEIKLLLVNQCRVMLGKLDDCAGILGVGKARFSLHSHSYTAEIATRLTHKRTS